PVPLGLGGTFDFGPAGGSVQAGFLPVTPADSPTSGAYAFAGVGWVAPGGGTFDRHAPLTPPNTPQLANLLVDGEWGYAGGGGNNGVFQVAVAPNQDVQVTVLTGDTFTGRDTMTVYVGTSPTGPFTKLNPTTA